MGKLLQQPGPGGSVTRDGPKPAAVDLGEGEDVIGRKVFADLDDQLVRKQVQAHLGQMVGAVSRNSSKIYNFALLTFSGTFYVNRN